MLPVSQLATEEEIEDMEVEVSSNLLSSASVVAFKNQNIEYTIENVIQKGITLSEKDEIAKKVTDRDNRRTEEIEKTNEEKMEENDSDDMSSSIEREEEEDGELPNIPYVPVTRFRKRNCPSRNLYSSS